MSIVNASPFHRNATDRQNAGDRIWFLQERQWHFFIVSESFRSINDTCETSLTEFCCIFLLAYAYRKLYDDAFAYSERRFVPSGFMGDFPDASHTDVFLYSSGT